MYIISCQFQLTVVPISNSIHRLEVCSSFFCPPQKMEDVPAPARAITVVSGIKIRVMSVSSLEKKLNYDAIENKLDLVVLTETWLLKCI